MVLLSFDVPNVALLLLLYTLQGIPLGLVSAVPFLLQKRNGFSGQALFSLSTWPFAGKMLFAPLVDSIRLFGMGPRKTWLVFSQVGIAAVMYITESTVDEAFDSNRIHRLMLIFFLLCTFASIQDIAVDGWALTMLKTENINWASTCNTVGQSIGVCIGNSLFMALNSPVFCQRYLNQSTRLLTISSFFRICAPVYLTVSILVGIAKREEFNVGQHVIPAYRSLWQIIQLPNIRRLAIIHFTAKIAFAAADNLVVLELSERGVTQDVMAFVATFFYSPIQIMLPLILSGRFSKVPMLHPRRPLDLYIKAYPVRLVIAALHIPAFMLYDRSNRVVSTGRLPWTLCLVLVVNILYRTVECAMFVAQMAFHAHVSEHEHLSGTYMTLTNSLANFGTQVCSSPAMKTAEFLEAVKWCTLPSPSGCLSAKGIMACSMLGGVCKTIIDPFYVISSVCLLYGLWWYRRKRDTLKSLQELKPKDWSPPRPSKARRQLLF